jgi:hypothetical protein
MGMQYEHTAWTCSKGMQRKHAAWTCSVDMQHEKITNLHLWLTFGDQETVAEYSNLAG